MKLHAPFLVFLLLLLVNGCASLQTSGEFQAGRNALLTGNTAAALPYFQSVAEKDPSYFYGTAYQEGVLGFLGRTQYTLGQLPQAQKTLERALGQNPNDQSARLYLGLTLARSDDRQRGLIEIESSMKAIYDFLEYVTQAFRFSFGQYWDPTRRIRSAIEGDLTMIRSKEINWPTLIADGEWLGKEIDEESDRARLDEWRDRNRENDGGDSTR